MIKIYDALIKAEQKYMTKSPFDTSKVQSIVADVNREIAERFTNNVKFMKFKILWNILCYPTTNMP